MRQQKQLTNGFMLLEFILYCAASTTVIMAFMYYTSMTHVQLQQYHKKTMAFLSLYSGMQYVINKLTTAPINTFLWKKKTSSEIIYTLETVDHGWSVVNNRFVHREGNYSTTEQRWITKKTYPIIHAIISCIFTLHHHNNQINAITITLKTTQHEQTTLTIDLPLKQLPHPKKPTNRS